MFCSPTSLKTNTKGGRESLFIFRMLTFNFMLKIIVSLGKAFKVNFKEKYT